MNHPFRLRPNRRLAPTAAALGLLGLALAAPLARAQTATNVEQIIKTKGAAAFASFETVDSTGCVIISTQVAGAEQLTTALPSTRTFSSGGHVDITAFNACTGFVLYCIQGDAGGLQFSVSKDLSSATLSGIISSADCQSGQPVNVSVNVSWVATSKATKNVTNTRYEPDGSKVVEVLKNTFRYATATGTVVADPFATFTNSIVITGNSFDGEIQASGDSSITITKP